ncbi:MAG: hypothetical protein QXX41_03170 [Nitrososphaerota archaeon]
MHLKKTSIHVILILFTSVFVRLYPTLISGLPFSTDSWPLVRNTEKILEYTPTQLGGGDFDDYNIYWPASQIFGAIASELLSIAPIDSMRITIPFTASLTPLMIYLIVRRLSDNDFLSFMAGLLFAAGGPHAIFTAGVTKESFTNMLFLASLYFFLLPGSIPRLLGFLITSLTVIMGHHLTYIVLIVVLLNLFFAEVFLSRSHKISGGGKLTMLIFLATAGSIYYAIYASNGLKISLNFSDFLSVSAFQVILFVSMLYVVARPVSRLLLILWILDVLATFAILLSNQVRPFIPGAPQLSLQVFFYACQFIFLGFLAVIGMYNVKKNEVDKRLYPIMFWLSSTLGLEAYAVFGAEPNISLTLTYRLLNFILPALGVMAAASILGNRRLRIFQWIPILCILSSAAAISMQSYSAVILQENYLGYQWLYLPQDFQQALWIKKYGGDLMVYGDLKVAYLVRDYLGLKVDPAKGYAFLAENCGSTSHGLLVTYRTMEKNGYVLGPYGVELPGRWKEKLMGWDLVYSTTGNTIYML